jgi:signal transduction histidine kinase
MNRHLHLDVAACAPDVEAVCDPDRLEQVIINLLSNAIRFSPDGGVIRVACAYSEMAGRRADDPPTPGLRISVADQGPGIPEAELESVFEKFVQASHSKNGSGGTGLGLAICREIVQAHRGRIWAENLATGGACFIFEFPLDLTPG